MWQHSEQPTPAEGPCENLHEQFTCNYVCFFCDYMGCIFAICWSGGYVLLLQAWYSALTKSEPLDTYMHEPLFSSLVTLISLGNMLGTLEIGWYASRLAAGVGCYSILDSRSSAAEKTQSVWKRWYLIHFCTQTDECSTWKQWLTYLVFILLPK